AACMVMARIARRKTAFAVYAGGGVRVPIDDTWGARANARWFDTVGKTPARWRVYNGVTSAAGARDRAHRARHTRRRSAADAPCRSFASRRCESGGITNAKTRRATSGGDERSRDREDDGREDVE